MVASMLTIAWLLGPFLLGAASYVVHDWRYLQLITVLPMVVTLVYWWVLPESPRWLLLKKKTKEALKVIQKTALVNKTTYPDSTEDLAKIQEELNVGGEEKAILSNMLKMLRIPRLAVMTAIIYFNWCVVALLYYGLSLNVGNLGGDLRINFLLSTTVELIGYVSAWVLLDRLGRKRSHCCFMVTAGVACLATIFTVSFGGEKLQWLTTALAMVGKLGVSACFTAIYLITAEIFPTVTRNFSLACSSAWGRIGSVVSPYVADLAIYIGGHFGRAVPLVIFGGAAVLAGLLALYLPETLHRTLPDTVEDAVNFLRNRATEKNTDADKKSGAEEMEEDSLVKDTTSAV